MNYQEKYLSTESEQEATERIDKSFSMFSKIVRAVFAEEIHGLIVSGPPGIGKSFQVELAIRFYVGVLKRELEQYEIIKGYATPISVYKALYRHRNEGDVVIFDDCDDALFDETALNIFKAALDGGANKEICWMADSKSLEKEDIPNRFNFKGGVIFLTNIDFENCKSSRLTGHLQAMMSRCHYMDLGISAQRDQLLRIRQLINEGNMLKKYDLTTEQTAQLTTFIFDNADSLRELSLRMVKKIAEIMVSNPDCWEDFVTMTCLKADAKFKKLYLDKEMKT